MILFYFFSSGVFLSLKSLNIIMRLLPESCMVVMGMAILMIAGEFDLSVGSELAFCSLIAAWSLEYWGLNPFLGLLLVLIAGSLMGILNGLIVTKMRISSLIATLGMMWVYLGIVFAITSGYPISYNPAVSSQLFEQLLVGSTGPIPNSFIWLISAAILLYILLERTAFGNKVFAVGSNKTAARMMGIDTNKVKIICFSMVGFLVGLSGVMQSIRIRGAYSAQGSLLNLRAIGGAVVGGTSIYGGVGTLPGSLIGGIIMVITEIGLTACKVPAYYFQLVLGLLIVLIVGINIKLGKK